MEDDARTVAKELLTSHPNFSVGRWALGLPYRRQEDLDALSTRCEWRGFRNERP